MSHSMHVHREPTCSLVPAGMFAPSRGLVRDSLSRQFCKARQTATVKPPDP